VPGQRRVIYRGAKTNASEIGGVQGHYIMPI